MVIVIKRKITKPVSKVRAGPALWPCEMCIYSLAS